jgi:hypothetical protein
VLANLEDRDDPWMVEPGGRLGLCMEAAYFFLVGELSSQDQLQGHDSIQTDLPCFEDHPHSAAGDLVKELIIAEAAQMRTRAAARSLSGWIGERCNHGRRIIRGRNRVQG